MQEKVNKEVATKEVEGWLDYKRVKDSERKEQKAQIDFLVEALMAGDLVLDESTNVFKHKLIFPISGLLETLEYKPRLSYEDLKKGAGNAIGIAGYIAAVTGKGVSHIEKMDMEDYKIARAIAVFFM